MPKASPTFSIITVTYNAEQTLERTLQSVEEQTYPNIEYIIVDGASKDGTLSLTKQYAHIITKIISEPDKGLYDAMNKGISMATGHYLCFLNAGDRFNQHTTLQDIVGCLSPTAEMPDVIYGHTAIVDNKGHFLQMRRLTPPEHLTWKSFRQGMTVCHQAFLARRVIAEPYNLSYRFSSDFDWCIRILKQSQNTLNTHLTLIDYLNEGVTTRHHKASLKERFKIMTNHYGWTSTILYHFWFVLRAIFKP